MTEQLCIVFAIALAVIPSVNAQRTAQDRNISQSGNRYLELCSSTEKPPEKPDENDIADVYLCAGFMMGVSNGASFSIAMLQAKNPSLASLKGSIEDLGICIPDGVKTAQEIKVTLKYIREHPEAAHLPSAALVVMAERNAFPCAKPKQ
jgi:hypothetical protein